MGFLARALEPRATKLTMGKLSNPPTWMKEFFGGMGGNTVSGIAVDEESALRYLTVYTCVGIRAETVASLPLPVYRRLQPRGKERAPDHPLYRLLHDQPNPEITSFQWRETLQGHLDLWGNCYSEIEYDNAMRPISLWPLTPKRVRVERDKNTKALQYRVMVPEGGEVVLPAWKVLHIPGFSLNGITGLSPIGIAREAIAAGMAAEEFGARFFANDASPRVVLEHPGTLSDPAMQRLLANWDENHQGLSKSHRTSLLEEGMKIHQLGIPPEDAQLLATRKFDRAEIAGMYRIPPHMIGDVERSSSWGTGIEQQEVAFVVFTIRPILVRWEQAIKARLIRPEERAEIFAEFLVDGLLRGDAKTRAEALALQRQNGIINADDWREVENMNPLPDGLGQVYLVPLNMASVQDMVQGQNLDRSLREQRSAGGRQRLAKSYRRVFEDVVGRIVRRERADVMRAAERIIQQRNAPELTDWLAAFYKDHAGYVERQVTPVFLSYAEAVNADAAAEVNADPNFGLMETFMAAYIAAFVSRYVSSSEGQLAQVIRKANEAGDDILKALETRLGEWEEKRPGKAAAWETNQASGAVAKETWKAAGVTKIRWHAVGRNCPYCASMDGKVVGVQSNFLQKGEAFQPDGADSPLLTQTHISHPPLHAGCDCYVSPG